MLTLPWVMAALVENCSICKACSCFLVCRQLVLLMSLYDAQELAEFFSPVALSLASDKVAEVREGAFQLVSMYDQLE